MQRDIGCRAATGALLDGLEGRLPIAARLDVEAHVARCARCADELADLAAARYQARRALSRYRSARALVSPVRARLVATRPSVRPGIVDVLTRIGRPAEAVLALAVLAFAFVGSLALVQEQPLGIDIGWEREPSLRAGDTETAFAAPRALDRDDPAWAVRFRYRPSPMVVTNDWLPTDTHLPSPDAGAGGADVAVPSLLTAGERP